MSESTIIDIFCRIFPERYFQEMTKAAPNKDNALKFMEWLSSDEAQKIYAETNNEYPVKPGVERSALVAGWGDFIPDSVPLIEVASLRAAALKLVEMVDFDG